MAIVSPSRDLRGGVAVSEGGPEQEPEQPRGTKEVKNGGPIAPNKNQSGTKEVKDGGHIADSGVLYVSLLYTSE